MEKYIIAIDQGTTGTTTLLARKSDLEIVARNSMEYKQIYPAPGLVEHDLNDIWETVRTTVKNVIKESNIDSTQIESIGITNQRETICPFNNNGVALHNALVWQDRRMNEFCQKNKEEFNLKFQEKTGLPLDPYFSGSKIFWLINNVESIKTAIKNNDFKIGTIDTYLLYKLTNGNSFATDSSNASRTLLYNLKSNEWDQELLEYFNVSREFLPNIQDSFSNFGQTKGLDFLPDGIKIMCILGDQQAALFGQAGYKSGDLKVTYGTGAFILLNTGNEIKYSSKGLLTTVAYRHNNTNYYALEGSTYIAGAAVQWLRDNLHMFKSSKEVEDLANQITNLEEMKNILFLPFFSGIGTPYWKPEATASILGLTRDTNQAHIARAVLEGIALSVNDSIQSIFNEFQKDINVEEIKVDGGAAANDLLNEIQASISNKKIIRPQNIETTAFGVLLGSLIASNELKIDNLNKYWKVEKTFSPTSSSYLVQKQQLWEDTIKKLYL